MGARVISALMSSEYAQQVTAALAKYTATQAGASWVTKALHPVQGGVVGIPDQAHLPVLLPEYKLTTTITKPASLAADENWSCCILGVPSDTTPVFWSAGTSNLDYRDTVAAETGFLQNVDTATDPHSVAGVLLSGVPGTVQAYRTRRSVENLASYRHTAKSVTAYATGSELYNQGSVFCGVYSRRVSDGIGISNISEGTPWFLTGSSLVEIPLHESDMAVMTPNFYTAPAKEGAYAVHRLTGPAQEFAEKRTPLTFRAGGGETAALAEDSSSWDVNMGTVVRFRMGDSAVSPAFPVRIPSTAVDEHCSFSVMIFRGLHPQMSITLKSVCCLEIIPSSTSPSRQFVVPSAKYDPVAIHAYYALANELPPVMASKHNFLGTLLPIIGSILPKVLPFLAPIANALTGAATRRIDAIAQPAPPPPPPLSSLSREQRPRRRRVPRDKVRRPVKRVRVQRKKR